MPEEQTKIYNDVIKLLPGKLRNRFNSLGAYVATIIEEYQSQHNVYGKKRLKNDQIQEIKVITFLKILREFLEDGVMATEFALNTFNDINIKGFKVGTTDFSKDADGTTINRKLYNNFKDILGEINFNNIENENISWSLHSFIESLTRKALDNEQSMDQPR
jgi:hypothetical protein